MIKILTIGVLLYFFYRLVTVNNRLPSSQKEEEDQFIDYEEVE